MAQRVMNYFWIICKYWVNWHFCTETFFLPMLLIILTAIKGPIRLSVVLIKDLGNHDLHQVLHRCSKATLEMERRRGYRFCFDSNICHATFKGVRQICLASVGLKKIYLTDKQRSRVSKNQKICISHRDWWIWVL